jgi:hypothetical protein
MVVMDILLPEIHQTAIEFLTVDGAKPVNPPWCLCTKASAVSTCGRIFQPLFRTLAAVLRWFTVDAVAAVQSPAFCPSVGCGRRTDNDALLTPEISSDLSGFR